VPPETEQTVMMKKIISATECTKVGIAMMNLALAHDGGDGPLFTTRRHNPREATNESLKDVRTQFEQAYGGLIKDSPDFAIFLGIRLSWIKNLDAIRKYQPKDGRPPNIEWTEEAKSKVADLFNGNHRYKLLLEQLADTLKQLDEVETRMKKYAELQKPSKLQMQRNVTDGDLKKKLIDALQKEGQFSVLLLDLGMWYDLCELQHVGIHISFQMLWMHHLWRFQSSIDFLPI
jgi:hypothetical protein